MAKHIFKTKVAGVTFPCPNTGVSRQQIIRDHVRVGGWLNAVAEPKNEHSSTAVGLLVPGTRYHVGYLSEKVSPEVFLALVDRKQVRVRVIHVTGARERQDVETSGVNIEVSWDDAVKRNGCGTAVLMLGLLILTGCWYAANN